MGQKDKDGYYAEKCHFLLTLALKYNNKNRPDQK